MAGFKGAQSVAGRPTLAARGRARAVCATGEATGVITHTAIALAILSVVWPTATLAQVLAPAGVPPAVTSAAAPPFKGVLLVGTTALPPSQAALYVMPLLGQPADAALLQKVRLAVAAAHDDAGLGLVSVDTPLLQGQIAIVRVQALSLGRVEVQTPGVAPGEAGAEASALAAQAAAALPALRAGQTPNLQALDKQLRLANLQPHRRWSVDFRTPDAAEAPAQPAARFSTQPGQSLAGSQDAPQAVPPVRLPGYSAARQGASRVDARVTASDDSALFGRVLLDNAGQRATGHERLRVQLGHGDLFGPGRSLDVTALVSLTHPERQRHLAVRYQHALPEAATLVTAELTQSRSKPGLVSGFFDVSGNSKTFNLSARHLLARRGALEPYLEAGLEAAVHDDVVSFFGVNVGSRVGTAPLALAVGATWQGSPWNAFGQVRVRHNSGWGPSSSTADYAGARFGARPDWTTLDFLAEARRGMGNGQEAVLRAQGQWTGDALVSPQQFRAGGQSLLRGLREGELSGDSGLALAAEYWWPLSSGHRAGALLDTARTHRNRALAGEPASTGATSAGLAWQWDIRPGVRLNASAARILVADRLPTSDRGDSRVHLLLDWSF